MNNFFFGKNSIPFEDKKNIDIYSSAIVRKKIIMTEQVPETFFNYIEQPTGHPYLAVSHQHLTLKSQDLQHNKKKHFWQCFNLNTKRDIDVQFLTQKIQGPLS